MYLFFSSSSFFNFSLAFLRSTDAVLGDLFIGDNEVLLLRFLLWRFGVGERLLRRFGVGDRLMRRLGDIERLLLLYNNTELIQKQLQFKASNKRLHSSIPAHHLAQ